MSYSTPVFMQGVKAGEDLTGKEGRAVKISADNTVILATALTDIVVGTVHSGNVSGKAVEIMAFGNGGEVVIGATVTAGQELAINATGQMIPAVSTNVVRAIAKVGATDAGNFVDVMFISYVKA